MLIFVCGFCLCLLVFTSGGRSHLGVLILVFLYIASVVLILGIALCSTTRVQNQVSQKETNIYHLKQTILQKLRNYNIR